MGPILNLLLPKSQKIQLLRAINYLDMFVRFIALK
jgi:hypothetical protein